MAEYADRFAIWYVDGHQWVLTEGVFAECFHREYAVLSETDDHAVPADR